MNIVTLFIVIPLGAALLLPIISRFSRRLLPSYMSLVAGTALLVLSVAMLRVLASNGPFVCKMGGWRAPFGINLVFDGLSGFMIFTISLVTFGILLFSIPYLDRFVGRSKFYTLLLLMITGMNGVVLTGDIFNFYVFLEIAAIASYALVAFGGGSEELEASFKYAVLGSIGSSLILLAVAFLYAATGTLNMADISMKIGEASRQARTTFVAALFISGLGLKAAVVPFHAWLPDAHPTAPAPISAMLSGLLIKALGVYGLARILVQILGVTAATSNLLLFVGAASMVAGAFLALGQSDLKRLLAYSSISHVGYMAIGLGLGTPLGVAGALLHLLNHAIFKSLLFLDSGSVEYATGTRDMEKLRGVGKALRGTSITTTIGCLSLGGIPPLGGFWSKLLIIMAAVFAGRIEYAILMAITSIVTAGYLLKILRLVFLGPGEGEWSIELSAGCVPVLMQVGSGLLAVLAVAAGIFYPYLYTAIISPAVASLLDKASYMVLTLGG